MTVFNILDQRRENEHNPTVDVVYEIFCNTSWEDFGLPADTEDYTEWQTEMSVHDAVSIAQKLVGNVTLFFYDPRWVIANFGFIVTIHPKLKRDVMVPHQMSFELYHSDKD